MKLNSELLDKIQEEIAIDHFKVNAPNISKINWFWANLYNTEKISLYPEVCRRYSEELIKCDECNGSGEHEINVDGMDAPSADGCIFCEGKGYQE